MLKLKFTQHLSKRSFSSILPLQHLNENEQKLVETVRNYAQTKVKPLVRRMDAEMKIDKSIFKDLFDMKLMGVEVAEKYGGAGRSFFDTLLAIEELAKVDPTVSGLVHLQNALIASTLVEYGSQEQKEKYLPKVCRDTIGSFALTEILAGSDAFAMKTTAVKSGDHYVINGSKWGITNAIHSGFIYVFANADPKLGHKGITCFLVETNQEGVTLGPLDDKLGLRASAVCSLHLKDVKVPESSIVGEFGKGYKYAIELLNASRILIGAKMLGLAQGCFDQTIPYLQERKQFGSRLIDFQGLQHQIAQVRTELETARLIVYNSARIKMAGLPFANEAAMTKYYLPEVASRTSKRCIEWLGGVGFTKDYHAEKFYRDAMIGGIYEGTSNIQLNAIARFVDSEYKKKKK